MRRIIALNYASNPIHLVFSRAKAFVFCAEEQLFGSPQLDYPIQFCPIYCIWVCLKMGEQYILKIAVLMVKLMINHWILGILFSGKP